MCTVIPSLPSGMYLTFFQAVYTALHTCPTSVDVHLRDVPHIALQRIPYIKRSQSRIRGAMPWLCRVRFYLGHFLHGDGSSFRMMPVPPNQNYQACRMMPLEETAPTQFPLHGNALILSSDASMPWNGSIGRRYSFRCQKADCQL